MPIYSHNESKFVTNLCVQRIPLKDWIITLQFEIKEFYVLIAKDLSLNFLETVQFGKGELTIKHSQNLSFYYARKLVAKSKHFK